MKDDHRSYRRNFLHLRKESLKKIVANTFVSFFNKLPENQTETSFYSLF